MATFTTQALLDLTVEALCDHHGLKYDAYDNLRTLVKDHCKFDIDPFTDGSLDRYEECRIYVPYRLFDYFKNICKAVKELAEQSGSLSAFDVAAAIDAVPFQESEDWGPVDETVAEGLLRMEEKLEAAVNPYSPLRIVELEE